MRYIISSMVIAALIVLSCSESINYPEIPPEQKFLFEFEYINGAWGWNHYGFYIDNEGNVYKFESPLDVPVDQHWIPSSTGFYSEEDLLRKYEMQKEFIMRIEMDDLAVRRDRIGYASKGELTDREHVMCDAGVTRYRCYVYYDDITGPEKYEEILLHEEGDTYVENLSPDAKYLYTWLKSLYDQYYFEIDEK